MHDATSKIEGMCHLNKAMYHGAKDTLCEHGLRPHEHGSKEHGHAWWFNQDGGYVYVCM